MAYKDEYEVARLYTDGRFQTAVFRDFERYAYLDAIARLTHTFSPDTLPRALEVAASPVQVRAATPAQRAAFVDYSIKALRPWMLRAQADFLERTRCGSTVEVPRSTHYLFLERPEWTAKSVLAFLASADPCHYPADE